MSDRPTEADLQQFLSATAAELGVPGATVGLVVGDEDHYAHHGVTSVENPLEVDERTLFQFGSTGKTFTATALMVLVDRGLVELDAPVRRYVPELRLRDESVAESVTVLQLLNHTAGWAGDLLDDTGDGDDALARYVELMADLEQTTPLGAGVSYNNASLSLAGRVIEHVTGTTFEQAIRDLLLDPLGMDLTFFFPKDVMTRRFAVGHRQQADGSVTVARPWPLPRGGAPAGGMSAPSPDLVRWARFHLGDGTAHDGTRVLAEELLRSMQQPTVENAGTLGDAIGISWFLEDVDGVRLVSHGGTTNGQHSSFVMVPEKRLAVSVMSNAGPNGPQLNDRVVEWFLEHHAGVVKEDPVATPRSDDELAPYAGDYETIAVVCHVAPVEGGLEVDIELKPSMVEQLFAAGEEVPEQPPFRVGFVEDDLFVVTSDEGRGMRGYFVREDDAITGMHLGGRLAMRADADARRDPAPV